MVTEYGAADLRGLSDRDAIAAMLQIADSRFQQELLEQAKAAGKIEADYVIPVACRHNTPERIANALLDTGQADWFPHFPWGSDMTRTEAALALALAYLKQQAGNWKTTGALLLRGLPDAARETYAGELARMGLARVSGLRSRILQRLLLLALVETGRRERPLKPLSPKYGDRVQETVGQDLRPGN